MCETETHILICTIFHTSLVWIYDLNQFNNDKNNITTTDNMIEEYNSMIAIYY